MSQGGLDARPTAHDTADSPPLPVRTVAWRTWTQPAITWSGHHSHDWSTTHVTCGRSLNADH